MTEVVNAQPLNQVCLRPQSCIDSIPELLSGRDKKPLYSIVKEIVLLSRISENNSEPATRMLAECFSQAKKNADIWRGLGSILAQDSLREIAFLAVTEEALTARTISTKTRQPQPTLYRNIKALTDLGVIAPCLPLRTPHEKGRRVVVYQVPDALPDSINRACELHRRLGSPNYVHAIRVSQQILCDYPVLLTRRETSKRDLLEMMRERHVPQRLQIIDLVIQRLAEQNIRVWR